ncbi:FAD dependent oxidoreductase [compost metagenome]
MPHVPDEALDWVPIEPEKLKRVYDDLVTGAGATVLFHTFLAAVEADGDGKVQTLLVANKAGLQALEAKVFVDCTGDADLAAWAGAGYMKGSEKSGQLQPATHCFALGNVDEYAYRTGPNLHGENKASPIYDIVKAGQYPLIPDFHMCNNLTGPRTVGFNAGHLWEVDNTDPYTVSAAMIQGRRMAEAYCSALAEYQPAAFGNAYVAATGALMGIRETRRIEGDYVLTAEDYVGRRSFPDEICRNSYFIDIHGSEEEEKTGANSQALRHYGPGESHGIPYRCLTPKKLRNVLVAGRSISCDRRVQGSVRVMPACLATGEAAGLAAALAAKLPEGDVHQVDTALLRRRLREEGAYLPE